MNDKICNTCKHDQRGLCYLDMEDPHREPSRTGCGDWSRDPVQWLATPPDAPGWYWWRENEGDEPVILDTGHNLLGGFVAEGKNGDVLLVSDMDGEWQGPISPA